MENKYIIKVFTDFTSSEYIKQLYENISLVENLSYYGKDKEIYFTTEEDYTHAIILCTYMPVLKDIPKENVIGLAYEPKRYLGINDEFIEYSKKYIGKYFIGCLNNLPLPFIENYSFMVYTKMPNYIPLKTKPISIIISFKKNAHGNRYRHKIVNQILNSDLPIDIYGNGCYMYEKYNNERVKGGFKDSEPYLDYTFHICIENYVENDYISEKFINCLTHKCIPIYMGAKNIDKYFPDTYIKLSGDIQSDMNLLTDICSNPNNYYKQIDYEKEEEKFNIVKNIKKLFQ